MYGIAFTNIYYGTTLSKKPLFEKPLTFYTWEEAMAYAKTFLDHGYNVTICQYDDEEEVSPLDRVVSLNEALGK